MLGDRPKYVHDSSCIDYIPHPIDGRAEAPGRENMSCCGPKWGPKWIEHIKIRIDIALLSLVYHYCTMGNE